MPENKVKTENTTEGKPRITPKNKTPETPVSEILSGTKSKKELKKLLRNGKKDDGVTPEKYTYVIKSKKARSEITQKKIVIIIAICLIIILLIGGLLYGYFTAMEQADYSIFISKEGRNILSLSETNDFTTGTEMLEIKGPASMDNTSLSDYGIDDHTPIEDTLLNIILGEGEQNGENYIATSFYLRNTTSSKQYFNEYLRMTECTKNIDSALRVMLVKDMKFSVYAKAKKDGTEEEVVPQDYGANPYPVLSITKDDKGEYELKRDTEKSPWKAQKFYDDEYVFYNKGTVIDPGLSVKYSLIIWLEGNDIDCVDEIIGGKLKIEFAFEQVSVADLPTQTE